MFSKELEISISEAYQEARGLRHEFLNIEHLLLALLENPSAASVLSACGADMDDLAREIRNVLEETVPVLGDEDERDTQPTISFQRVLQRAMYHIQSSGKTEVLGSNVLVALFNEKDSYAAYLLNKHEISRLDVVNYISHGMAPAERDHGAETAAEEAGGVEGDAPERTALERYATNLNERARHC